MAFFQPTDITGCFAWYRASSIGYGSNSGLVTYWPDESGSGNYLNLQYNGSGSTTAPYYWPNVINGLPAVFFDGTINRAIESYPRRAGIPQAVSGITLFTAFSPSEVRSSNPVWCICSDQQASADKNTAIIGVGNVPAGAANMSGWWFGWGRDAGFGMTSYSHNTNIMSPSGEWVVRTDKFSLVNNRFTFAKNGADVATGIASTSYNTSTLPWIALGADNENQQFYKGYIGEAIAYNRRLEEVEVTQVEDYLRFKYNVGCKGIPLFTWGTESPTGLSYNDFPLYVAGGSAVSTSGISLYTVNKDTSTSGISAYISGSAGSYSDNRTLYIGNVSVYTTGIPLYTSASTLFQTGVPLWISGIPSTINTNIPLYTSAASVLSSGQPLYMTGSVGTINTNIPLWISAASTFSTGIPLYIGASTLFNSGITLYTSASTSKSSGVPLYIPGNFEIDRTSLFTWGLGTHPTGIKLYISASTSYSSGTSLYTGGKIATPSSIYLYISGTTNPSITSYIPAFLSAPTTAGRSGIYDTIPMYMYSHGVGNNLPLYLKNTQDLTPLTNNLYLYISGPITSGVTSKNTPLFLQNNTSQLTKAGKLFMQGDGSMAGASIYSKNMPLFIRQASGGYNGTSIYMFGVGVSQSGTSLFTKGVYTYSSGISMFISGSGNARGMSLYMNTQSVYSSGKSLYVYGRPTISNSTIMYVNGY